MANIIITKVKRGCFDEDEFNMFEQFPDKVYLRCRDCENLIPVSIAAYKEVNIYTDPIQCSNPLCPVHGYNITATWCNFTERPKSWAPISSASAVYSEKSQFDSAMSVIAAYRLANGGKDKDWDDAQYKIIRENFWTDLPVVPVNVSTSRYSNAQHTNEVFHEWYMTPPYNIQHGTSGTPPVPVYVAATEVERLRFNDQFYRAIVNIVIQTEVPEEETGG